MNLPAASRIDVTVVRRFGPPVASMERYADAVAGSSVDGDIRLRSFSLRPTHSSGITGRLLKQSQRWVTGPIALRQCCSNVVHLIDHSESHLLRILPTHRSVVTCHDLLMLRAAAGELSYMPPRRFTARFRWSLAHLERAAAVVCVSESTRQDVLRFLSVDPSRLHVIPNAVAEHFHPSTSEQRASVRRELGLNAKRIVLHVSSGGFYKNDGAVLEVVANLRRAGIDAVLLRVGAALSGAHRALADRLDVTGAVWEQGRVSDDILPGLYGAADVFVFPSSAEGFGWPVLEAMTCGLPVVASSIPPLVDLVGDAALLAPPSDIDGLSTAAVSVLNDPIVADHLRAAGRRRASEYRWDRTLASYARIYREVARLPSAT